MNPAVRRERLGTTAGKIVDGAVDREITDIAAGKKQRVDHIGVRGQCDPAAEGFQYRRVAGWTAGGAECREEEVLDEFLGEDATAAVAHDDALGLT